MSAFCIAHRGGAGLRPENTLAAFAHAVALGADGAELDVQMTRDGEVVVHHDHRLNAEFCRDAAGAWIMPPTPKIVDLTYAELLAYDVGRAEPGSAYAGAHPGLAPWDGERIPLLSQVVQIARRAPQPFRLFVELKTSLFDRSLSVPAERLAEAVIAILHEEDFADRAILVGFDWRGLIHAKKIAPDIACWFTTPEHSRFSVPEAIVAAGGDGWFPHFKDATAEAIAAAHRRRLKVGAWTVDDPEIMRTLMNCGVDAICTDRPDRLATLKEHTP